MINRAARFIFNKVNSKKENLKASYTESLHERMYISLKDCTSINGFVFKDGWHFLVATLEQYEKNPNIKYEETFLARYYDCYQPKNLQESLYGKGSNIDIPSLIRHRDPQNAPMPWTPMFKLPNKYKTNLADYGPKDKSSDDGEVRFRRLTKIYDSIKSDGFREELNKNVINQIKGVLLKNNNDFRFLVFNGNHRTAALSALGFEKIPFRFVSNYPVIVDIENIDNWPCVKTGFYDRNVAEKIFLHYFEENGVNKAKEWGIF